MRAKPQQRWDLLILLSLLLLILTYPLLDHGDIRRLILGLVAFIPIILVTLRMSQIKLFVWPSVILMCCSLALAVAETLAPHRTLTGLKWAILSLFFSLGVAGLFNFLKNSRSVGSQHLYTAVNIYLLMAFLWFSLYSAIDVFRPGSFLVSTTLQTDRQTELLYFSLVTLSTLGSGNIVALHAEVRMLAALEAITGVLYIAITVALLVSSYKQRTDPTELGEGTN